MAESRSKSGLVVSSPSAGVMRLIKRQRAPQRTRVRQGSRRPKLPAESHSSKPSRRIASTEELQFLSERIRVCTRCRLCESRINAVPGEGRPDAPVMIIGEGPGAREDKLGKPFVGSAGRYLDHILAGTRFTREDFFITNIVKCRPPGNRTPRSDEAETCTSLYLNEQIRLVRPKLILLLGSVAVARMLGMKSVEEARGRAIERNGSRFLASYHPAVRFYREDLAAKIKEDFALLTRELNRLEPPA